MTRGEWITHALVFVAAVFLIWLSGVLPVLVMAPGAYAGLGPMEILSAMGAPTLEGLLRGWPIYIAIAIAQALTFHYVKKWPALFFLPGVFIAGSLLAWRFWLAPA